MHTDLKRLESLAAEKRWAEMGTMINSLGASALRVASTRLADYVLPKLRGDDFWSCMAEVVPQNRRALLGTFLKVGVVLYAEGHINIDSCPLKRFAKETVANKATIDRSKTLRALLPVLRTSSEVGQLLDWFDVPVGRERVEVLADCLSPAVCYVIFQEMRRLDGDEELLTHLCHRLLAHKERLGFNLVSICRLYFDLPAVKGTFSLSLNTHQLSSLEQGEETFGRLLLSI